jgi:hypothetical protein
MILSPEPLALDRPRAGKKRLMVIMGKQLPILDSHKIKPAFVDAVSDEMSDLINGLHEKHYTTDTRGEREMPAARPCGEGIYEIIRHGSHGQDTHFLYELELPEEPGK